MNDISQYERVLTALHSVADDLTEMESRDRICQRTIDAAENLLDFDFSIIALEADEVLHPAAISTDMPLEDYDTMSIHEGIAGETYRKKKSFLIEDSRDATIPDGETQWRSIISLPVGGHGNFQAVDEQVGAFDERDLQLAELLVTHTANHLDRVAAKESLEERNKRLNEFASIVSHDLRNPLNVATGHLELAASECDSEHLDDVDNALSRMENLVDRLLVLARDGTTISDPQPVSLNSVVEDSWSNVAVGSGQIRIETEMSIVADRDRVGQLLENLFRNAVDHGTDPVTVTVGELESGFFVEDDGPGIEPDDRQKVFDSGYTTSEIGIGLGLNIVRDIVDAHGWDIRVIDGKDGGARFEITDVEFAENR